MFRLYAIPSCGVGRLPVAGCGQLVRCGCGQVQVQPGQIQPQVYGYDVCSAVNFVLSPLSAVPAVKKLLTQYGCCTSDGKKELEKAINSGIDSMGLDESAKSVVKAVGNSAIRGCVCKSVNCSGGSTDQQQQQPGKSSNTWLWVAGGVGVAALLGGFFYFRGRH